ncbi:MAG: hypothetical protein ACR2FF_06520 [Mycobacteriales bacterium]|nr:MAG: hypothetical protein DLM56_08275 [Pseudonocardiales bacterium]
MSGYQQEPPSEGQDRPGYPGQAGGQAGGQGQPESFPNAPTYQQQPYAQAPAPQAVPSTINSAFWLIVLSSLLGIVGSLLLFGSKSKIINNIKKNNPGYSTSKLNNNYHSIVIFAVIISIIFAALYIFFALKIRAGRNWARIVVTVLLVLGILGGLANAVNSNYNGAFKAFSVIGLILNVAILVLLWLRPSNEYMASVKASQRPVG